MEGFRIINPTAFERAKACVAAGRFGTIESTDFELLPFSVQPIEGYAEPPGFPEKCCVFHQKVYGYAVDAQSKFPNCCEDHKNLITAKWFQPELYKDTPRKTLSTLHYAEHAISTLINGENWYNDITDYLDYCYESFGQLPAGYGNPLGIGLFHTNIIHWLEDREGLEPTKRAELLQYFNQRFDIPDRGSLDINILLDTYRKWLAIFPFTISFFRDIKDRFVQAMPPLLKETTTYNKYSKKKKAKLLSVQELTSFLTELTKQLLKEINTQELVRQSVLPDISSRTVEIINEDFRIKNELLLGAYSNGELEYLRVLSTWLTYQKEYFKDIKDFVFNPKTQSADKQENLMLSGMAKYGFYELPKVKALNSIAISQLENHLTNNHIPYQIAMFDYLGFIEHLTTHFQAKYKVNKELSKWFNADKEGRMVKANIATLNPQSKEDRDRYTAHLHKETVKKDYQKLK